MDKRESPEASEERQKTDQRSDRPQVPSKQAAKPYRKPSIVRHGNLRMMTQLE